MDPGMAHRDWRTFIWRAYSMAHDAWRCYILGSATPKINVKQSGRLVVVLIVLNGSNTLALINPRGNCSELRSKVECALINVLFTYIT